MEQSVLLSAIVAAAVAVAAAAAAAAAAVVVAIAGKGVCRADAKSSIGVGQSEVSSGWVGGLSRLPSEVCVVGIEDAVEEAWEERKGVYQARASARERRGRKRRRRRRSRRGGGEGQGFKKGGEGCGDGARDRGADLPDRSRSPASSRKWDRRDVELQRSFSINDVFFPALSCL